MKTPDDIREYIGKAQYDEHGQMIFRGADKDNLQMFLDVRGWGSIQHNMGFKTIEEAENFQDRVGQWVTDVINEKLRSEEPNMDPWTCDDCGNSVYNCKCNMV